MRRIGTLLISMIAVSTALPALADEKLKVATTFTIIADMARNVGGEAVEVESLTKPGAEIHYYQPTPGDIIRARDADMVLLNGLNLEQWFERFLRNLGDIPSVTVTEGIEPLSIVEGPYEGKPNPHAWMSPDAAITYVENIRAAFAEADPENAELYAENAAAYSDQIRALTDPIRKSFADIPEEQRWLVTSEGAFSYLARDFDLRELYIWPINADQQGTPQQVRNVIDTVRENNIPVVFSESTVPPDAAEQIARETGAEYGGVLYVDSLSEANGPVPTYIELMRVTTGTIAEGLLR
ncbi:metal ABC transporter substrate-binding protein [Amaricoccus macauensis]|uniref:metal ABC transporter substrate-binding protein n=1 Tax=Amaricoccus macauensis TaxID=57001 RepID=UPI003C7E5647